MLNITQKLNITGSSQIDGQTAVRFWASIDTDNPEKLTLNHSVINGDLYRDNRDECEKDGNEFDDEVLAIQDEMEQQDADVENLVESDGTEPDHEDFDSDESDIAESDDTEAEAEEGDA